MNTDTNRLAKLLNGKVVGETVVVSGKFDGVRAERMAERHGCVVRYVTRKSYNKVPGSNGWSPFAETISTVFDFSK